MPKIWSRLFSLVGIPVKFFITCSMIDVYFISGLGADSRIFKKLTIDGAQLHFIEWVMPETGDTMRSYALKLAGQIKHENVVLVGVSYGGMLASEISRAYDEALGDDRAGPGKSFRFRLLKTILISSCKHPAELPTLMRLAGLFQLHKMVPYSFILRNSRLNRFVFELKSREDELYVKQLMLRANDPVMIKKSVNIILKWKASIYKNLVHIHGTADRLLISRKVAADYWIDGGSHFMIWNRAKEISDIINRILRGLQQ